MREVHPQPWLSVEDYLGAEQDAVAPHDYVEGALFPVEQPEPVHDRLVASLRTLLTATLGVSRCRVMPPGVRVRIENINAFYHPDLVVTCTTDPAQALRHIIRQPRLIIEVMSMASRLLDQREKRLNYQRIPSVREILLIDAVRPRMELYRRQEDRWTIETISGEGEVLLPSLGVTLTLDAIYGTLKEQ